MRVVQAVTCPAGLLQVPLILRFGAGLNDLRHEQGEEGGSEAWQTLLAPCNATTTVHLPPLPLHLPPSCIVKFEALLLLPDRSTIAASDHVRVCIGHPEQHNHAYDDDIDDAAHSASVSWLEGELLQPARVMMRELFIRI